MRADCKLTAMAAHKWMTWKTWLILIIAIIVAATVLVGTIAQKLLALRMGAVHTFTLPSPPRFLSDSLAQVKARQALENEGYNIKAWQPIQMSKSSDPDGNRDKYLNRDPVSGNGGTILFSDSAQSSAKHQRIVRVTLKANQVECQVVNAQ